MSKLVLYIFLVLLFFETGKGQSKSFPREINFRSYLNSENFGNEKHDTVYFNMNGGNKVDRIIQGNLVYQYFVSGNLLGQGLIKEKECDEIVNQYGVVSRSCSYQKEGIWEVYYDSSVKIKYADVSFKSDKEIACLYYNLNGIIIKREESDGKIIVTENMDSSGNLIRRTEHMFVNNKKKILSETLFFNHKEKKIIHISSFVKFFLINNEFFFFSILILLTVKLLSGAIIFRLYYNLPEFNNYNIWSKRLYTSMRATFSLYIKSFEKKYYPLFLIHNFCAIALIILFIVFMFCLNA